MPPGLQETVLSLFYSLHLSSNPSSQSLGLAATKWTSGGVRVAWQMVNCLIPGIGRDFLP